MDQKLNSIKLIIEDIQNQVIDEEMYNNSLKSENINKLEKLVDTINNYTTHDWTTGYGMKYKKNALNIFFEIILEQNKRISTLEKLVNSTSTHKFFHDKQDDDPDPHGSKYCDNNNHRDSKEL